MVYNSIFYRVVYRFDIFGRYLVGISWYLPNQYRRKTRSVHFGIIILVGTPFFLKRGVTAPFFRGPAPILRKKGFPAKPLRVPTKFFSAQNTDQNTDRPAPVYGISIPILAKLPVSKRYPTLEIILLRPLRRGIPEFSYEFSQPPEYYIETCTSFYVFPGPRWLTGWVGYWTPTRSHHRSTTSRC